MHSAVYLPELKKILVTGSERGVTYAFTNESYNPAVKRWREEMAKLQIGRFGHTTVVTGKQIWVFGG